MKYICVILLVWGVCFVADGVSSVNYLKVFIGGILLGTYVHITYKEVEV